MNTVVIAIMPDGVCIMKGSAYRTLGLAREYKNHDYPYLITDARCATDAEISFWTDQIKNRSTIVINDPPMADHQSSQGGDIHNPDLPNIGTSLDQAAINALIDHNTYHCNRIGNNRNGEMIITLSHDIRKPVLMTFLLVETAPIATYQRVY